MQLNCNYLAAVPLLLMGSSGQETGMLNRILRELKRHAPFTLFGALTAIVLMLLIVVARVAQETLEPFFEGFHSIHVLLSAIVTSAMVVAEASRLTLGVKPPRSPGPLRLPAKRICTCSRTEVCEPAPKVSDSQSPA